MGKPQHLPSFLPLFLLLALPVFAEAKAKKEAPAPLPAPELLREVQPIPKRFHLALERELPRGQRLVQTLVADLDGDGVKEWIAVGEPKEGVGRGPSLSIFSPAQGKKGPELRWAQHLRDPKLRVSGVAIATIRPIGSVILWVGAEPFPNGDSRFALQVVAYGEEDFRTLIPEPIELRSQGGFSLVQQPAAEKGDALLVWTYLRGENEQLYDLHRYRYQRWSLDERHLLPEGEEKVTAGKYAHPDEAGREAGAKSSDLRRQIERVAEVP